MKYAFVLSTLGATAVVALPMPTVNEVTEQTCVIPTYPNHSAVFDDLVIDENTSCIHLGFETKQSILLYSDSTEHSKQCAGELLAIAHTPLPNARLELADFPTCGEPIRCIKFGIQPAPSSPASPSSCSAAVVNVPRSLEPRDEKDKTTWQNQAGKLAEDVFGSIFGGKWDRVDEEKAAKEKEERRKEEEEKWAERRRKEEEEEEQTKEDEDKKQ